jgi:hypothetical protein
LPRPLHPPAPPGLRLRVSPYHAPFLLSRRPTLRVAPWLQILRLCRRCPLGLPRTSHAFGAIGFNRLPGFPGGSCILPQRPRWRTWVAPRPASPALTGDRSSSRLDSLSFGGAGCESSRLPSRFAHPVSPTISTQVALNAHLPAPADGMSESPRIASPSGSRLWNLQIAPATPLRLRCSTNFQVTLNLGSLSVRRFGLSRVTPKPASSADPYLLQQVAPLPHLRLGR